MKIQYWAISLLLIFVSAAECGGPSLGQPDGAGELRSKLADLHSITANFTQQVFSADDFMLQESAGELSAARPGKVRWVSTAPFEQWIIGDGQFLWVYDPDLEQVTVRPFSKDLAKTPAILFIGELDGLEQSYLVYSQNSGNSYTLIPKAQDSLYQKLSLRFNGSTPAAMSLWDSLGQRTEISFSAVETNTELPASLFSFVAPEGVDILRDD